MHPAFNFQNFSELFLSLKSNSGSDRVRAYIFVFVSKISAHLLLCAEVIIIVPVLIRSLPRLRSWPDFVWSWISTLLSGHALCRNLYS